MDKERVCLVSGDASIENFCSKVLEKAGLSISICKNGDELLEFIEESELATILLDCSCIDPKDVGIVHYLSNENIPVAVIGYGNSDKEKTEYLNAGADRYLSFPVNPDELTAEIKALLRRSGTGNRKPELAEFACDALYIDYKRRLVTVKGKEIHLSQTEYELLKELTCNAGRVLSHNHLLRKIWGHGYQDERQHVHLYISYLRKKIESDPHNPQHIISVTGVGYMFKSVE